MSRQFKILKTHKEMFYTTNKNMGIFGFGCLLWFYILEAFFPNTSFIIGFVTLLMAAYGLFPLAPLGVKVVIRRECDGRGEEWVKVVIRRECDGRGEEWVNNCYCRHCCDLRYRIFQSG